MTSWPIRLCAYAPEPTVLKPEPVCGILQQVCHRPGAYQAVLRCALHAGLGAHTHSVALKPRG